MKNQTKKVLQKTGVILAMVMLFTMLAVPAWADETGSGTSFSASTSSSDTTPAPVAGDPYIAAYTVTDAAGAELQRIEEGQKCRIIIAVVDPRITSADQLTLADGRALAANIKITSTASFASPSLGDIATTVIPLPIKSVQQVLQFATVLNAITCLGGDDEPFFRLAYKCQMRANSSLRRSPSASAWVLPPRAPRPRRWSSPPPAMAAAASMRAAISR